MTATFVVIVWLLLLVLSTLLRIGYLGGRSYPRVQVTTRGVDAWVVVIHLIIIVWLVVVLTRG